MTDETKQLFNAPWTEGYDSDTGETWVTDKNGRRVADTSSHSMRIVRLPELYAALAEATMRCCGICHNLSGQDEPKIEDLIKNGCPKAQDNNRAYVVSCVAMKWLDLLKKVRDGE